MPLRRTAGCFAFAFVCYLLSPWLGLGSFEVDPRIAEVWPTGGVGFVLLTTVWFAGRRVLGATIALMVAIFVVTAVAMDFAPHVAVWLALTGVSQPLLMIWLYRRRLEHSGWSPESPHEVAALLYAAVGSSVLLGLVGGFPFLSPDELPSEVLLWWVLRNAVFCFVGGATFLVFFYGRRSTILPTSSWLNRIGLLGCALLCVYGTYNDPALPLSWLLIVPSVWGGLTLTVRGGCYVALTVALLAAAMTYLPQNEFGYGGILPPSLIVDLLVIASTTFALLLTLMRATARRADLRARPQGRGVREATTGPRDGLRLDEGRRRHRRQLRGHDVQQRRTPAARSSDSGRPAGRRGPRPSTSRTPREPGSTTTPCAQACTSRPGDAHAKTLEVHVGHGDAARILDISAQPLGTTTERSTIVLLHDVTAQRARLRELSNFAGMVAHDLRGPLTVLDGWLEVVQDGDAIGDEFAVVDAVAKARDASQRMRQVIEDWLNYTVIQNGQLRPDAVKLDGGRQRDRGERPGQLGGGRRAPVHARPQPTASRPTPACSASSWTTSSGTPSSTPPPTRHRGSRSARNATRSRDGSGSTSSTVASGSRRRRGS